MSDEIARLQDQLKRAFSGAAWHGPAILELLADVSAEKAAAHPLAGVHSIWELTLHISAWEQAAVRRLNGDCSQLRDEENFPFISDTTETAWRTALETLKRNNQQLLAAIAALKNTRLDEPIMEGMSTVYVTLHGVIQHDLYHAGQIAILKKL